MSRGPACPSMAFRLPPASLPALLLLALAVSGCAGKDPGQEPPSPADAAAAPGPAASETVVATRSAVETPVHVEGSTYTGGCAYAMGQGTCRWENGDHAFVELGKDGEPSRFAGTVTWSAATPDAQEMSVYVFHLRDDGYYWLDDESPMATGPSPLAFDFDLSEYKDTQVAFGVSDAQGTGLLVAYASAGTSQAFAVDGAYTSIVLRA